jgi:electron transfer flavoprotein alpha subunit
VLADADVKLGMAPSTYHVVSAAEKLGKEMSFVCTTKESAEKASKLGKVYLADGVKTADVLSRVIADLQKKEGFTHILGSTSDVSKDTLPRVGAHLDIQPLSDILSVIDEKTFTRPMYAGNAIATVESTDPVKICTVRTTAFDPAAEGSGSHESSNVEGAGSVGMEFVSESVKVDDKPQLGSANVVVSGGRALGSSEAFDNVLQPLCDKLKAAMGASRAAVDAGYCPNEMQVGQTGKVVAPDCYVAVGISGAIQHLAGMKDSKTIVAINKDPDAPIFQVADYGLVGDLFEKVPELTEKL